MKTNGFLWIERKDSTSAECVGTRQWEEPESPPTKPDAGHPFPSRFRRRFGLSSNCCSFLHCTLQEFLLGTKQTKSCCCWQWQNTFSAKALGVLLFCLWPLLSRKKCCSLPVDGLVYKYAPPVIFRRDLGHGRSNQRLRWTPGQGSQLLMAIKIWGPFEEIYPCLRVFSENLSAPVYPSLRLNRICLIARLIEIQDN